MPYCPLHSDATPQTANILSGHISFQTDLVNTRSTMAAKVAQQWIQFFFSKTPWLEIESDHPYLFWCKGWTFLSRVLVEYKFDAIPRGKGVVDYTRLAGRFQSCRTLYPSMRKEKSRSLSSFGSVTCPVEWGCPSQFSAGEIMSVAPWSTFPPVQQGKYQTTTSMELVSARIDRVQKGQYRRITSHTVGALL